MPNKDLALWCTEPKNIEHGIFMWYLKKQQWPSKNRFCPVCCDNTIVRKIEKLSESELYAAVKTGKIHGWNIGLGRICMMNNVVYHQPCLRVKLGDTDYTDGVSNGSILEE